MLQPVRTKYRKAHKGRIHGTATRASRINYGSFALKAMAPERIIGKQIEAARVALTRHMKRQGRVWTRIFPNIPVSKKNLLKCVWVKVKEHLNIGLVELNQGEFYLK
jgi:large subunit ribosomal protein L16